MKKITVGDLRYRFSLVEDLLRDFEEIQIVRGKIVIGRLLPPESRGQIPRPDVMARLKKIFTKPLKISGAQLLARERERFEELRIPHNVGRKLKRSGKRNAT